jgi:lipoate-protein ligase A
MTFHILPTRTGGAAENMALDFLLLQRYPPPAVPRFRHYAWRSPAFTFGYSQKISFVRQELTARVGTAASGLDICRRPTGGGLVDHRDDWTYALVIPRGQALEELRATQSYRVVHEALAQALIAQGVPAKTMVERVELPSSPSGLRGADEVAPAPAGQAGICFERA